MARFGRQSAILLFLLAESSCAHLLIHAAVLPLVPLHEDGRLSKERVSTAASGELLSGDIPLSELFIQVTHRNRVVTNVLVALLASLALHGAYSAPGLRVRAAARLGSRSSKGIASFR